MRARIPLLALLLLVTVAAWSAPAPADPKDAAYHLTFDNLLPGDKDLKLQVESWDGKLRVATLIDTGLAAADVTGLALGAGTLTGPMRLTIPPKDPKVDKPVVAAVTVELRIAPDGFTATGTFKGTRGEAAIEGAVTAAVIVRPTSNVGAFSGGRHGDYTKKAALGEHLSPAVATFFGGPDHEAFIDAGSLADGTIVAFGNAWGPRFPETPVPTMLGAGTHSGTAAVDARGQLVPAHPDLAGFVAVYSADATKLVRVLKLDWGVAGFSAGLVTNDGAALLVAGRCGKAFATFSALAKVAKTLPYEAPPPPTNPKVKPVDPATLADVFVARMSPEGAVEWLWVLEKANVPPPDIFCDDAGAVYCDVRGMRRIAPDGSEMTLLNTRTFSGTAKWLGVDPKDGGIYYGGDRNTNTSWEPYRQPYLYKYDVAGNKLYTLWEPVPKDIGAGAASLQSDSAPRNLAWAKDGTMIVTGWSDGGNSVFPRQALDWRKPAKGGGMGIATWGMKNANSLGHIMVIDPKTQETMAHSWWASFIPTWFSAPANRGAPNGITISQVRVLTDGSVAIAGGAATGLIQTPNPFWTDPRSGDKYGGTYVAVFKPDLTNLRFSSHLPGCSSAAVGATKDGLVVVSASTGKDAAATPTLTPSVNALQPNCAGGTDGHLVLLVP